MVSTLSSLILEFWILWSHLLFTNHLKHEVNRSSGYPFCEKTPFRKSTSCENVSQLLLFGKTIRHLATRVKEHGTSPSPSAVSNHLSSCETCKLNFSCDSFSIIDSGKNDFEITIKEALHIKLKKPTINRQLFTQGSSFVLNVF